MVKYSDIKIPGQKEEDLKGQTNQLLAASQLKNTIGSMDAEFKAFSALLDNSMRNTSSFNQQQEESYKLIAEEAAANRFSQQFKPERVDEEMEALAKEAGYESRGKIFFGRDDTINTGYMGHAAAIDAGNMFSGNFELISTNQAALRTKTQMMGSNSLLSKSKAWNAIKGQFNLSGPDKDYYKYHTTTDNNWERLTNINSLESLAMAVPIVDPLFNILADQTPEEKLLGRKEPGFDGGAIVSAIAKDDPDFLAFLNYQGVDLKALKEAANPFHFRWIMNSTIQANAISSSTAASEAYHSPITNWTLFGADQLKGSLTSGDFVAQIVLTAATAGLGSVVAGTATVINATTASSRVEGAVTASKTAIKVAQAGKTIREMKNWLPVNLPTTLMHKAAPTGLSFGKGGVASFGAWVTGQSIEGFLEEGLTDIFNQAYEKNEGFRIKYNYEQMWKAALMGAAMEPILGGAIGVATIPINLTVSTIGSVGLDVGGKLFSYSVGIKPIRVREMNLYFEEFMGKFESLSPEEQQIRIGMVTSGLVTEAALNEATGGTFGQIDSPENQLLLGRVLSLIDGGERTNPGQGREFLSNLAVRLQGIRQQLVGANNKTSLVAVEDKQFIEFSSGEDQSKINNTRILYTDGVDKVLTVKDGNLTFTKDGAELLMFAMIVNAQSSSETASDNIVEMMSFLGRDRLQEVVKKNNPHLNKETLSEDETRELTDKVLEIITTEGETEFTRIMEEINSSFEVLQHIDLDLQEDGVNTVMIQVDPEVAKRIIESKKITRAQIQKVTSATPVAQAATVATEVTSEPTPGTILSIRKYGNEKDSDLSIEAAASGRKPLTKVPDTGDYAKKAKAAGLVSYLGPPGNTYDPGSIVYGLPNDVSRAAAKEYWEFVLSPTRVLGPERWQKIGRLFGYTEKEIEDFNSGKTPNSELITEKSKAEATASTEAAAVAPEAAAVAPEAAAAAPEAAAAAPEATPAAPEATPAAPEATPAAPEATPAAPEATPAAPEATPAAPEATPATPTLSVVASNKLKEKAKKMGIPESQIKKAEEIASSIADNDWLGLHIVHDETQDEARDRAQTDIAIKNKFKGKPNIAINRGGHGGLKSVIDSRVSTKSLEQALAELDRIPEDERYQLDVRFIALGLANKDVTILLQVDGYSTKLVQTELAKRKATEATPKAPEAIPKAPEAIPTIAPTAAATTNLTLNDAEIKTRLESLPPELLNALNNLPSC